MAHLKNMSAPYQYLGLKFIPLGGLNIQNVASYLESPLITAIGGSWIATKQQISEKQWAVITAQAKDALAQARGSR